MTDEDLRRLADEAVTAVDAASCPSPERLRAAAERTGTESERLATLEHVAGCAACRGEFDLMRAVARAQSEETRSQFRRVGLMGLAATAVLLLGATLLWRLARPPAGEPVRGPAGSLSLLAPAERWAEPSAPRFIWSGLGPGTIYIFELVDAAGHARHSVTTGDTVAALPDSLRLEAGAEYRWWVRARRADGQEVVSPPRRLEISPRR